MILGLLFIKPYMLLFPCLFLVLKKRWKAIAGVALSCVFCILLSLPVGGWHSISAWIKLCNIISQSQDLYGIHPQMMYTVKGVLHFIMGTSATDKVVLWWIALSGIITIVICFSIIRTSLTRKNNDIDSLWAMILTGTLLVSPHANFHDLTLLVPCYMVISSWRFIKLNKSAIWLVMFSIVIVWGTDLLQPILPENLLTVSVVLAMLIMLFFNIKNNKSI